MKKKKKKDKSKKQYLTKIKSAQNEKRVSLPDGNSYYMYNTGRFIGNDRKIAVDIGSDGDTYSHIFAMGLKAGGFSDIILNRIDASLNDEDKQMAFKGKLEGYGVFQSINIIPYLPEEAPSQFDDKSLDIIFLFAGKEYFSSSLLLAWYPKLKDNGWLIGAILPYEATDNYLLKSIVDDFALNRSIGYSILSWPLTDNMFEVYTGKVTDELRRLQENLNLGNFIVARQLILYMEAQYPHSPFMANLRAELEYQCGMVENSRKLLTKIVNSWPHHVRALNNLAAIEINHGNYNHAKEILEKILRIDPFNHDAQANLAEVERRISLT